MNQKYPEEAIHRLWAGGHVFKIAGKPYTMHKMSYGDYFAESTSWKGGEKDGFAPSTLWYEKINDNGNIYYQVNKILASIN